MQKETVFALGFFDGVHLGHQALLKACRELADKLGCQAGAVTFTSHPDALTTGFMPALINTGEDRKKLLLQFHMDTVWELPFDNALMQTPWQDFFQMLLDHGAAGLVCGEDYRFGSKGAGNAACLLAACKEAGIPCRVIPQQKIDGTVISSTHIRALLEAGQVEQANRFLGHPHILSGTVISGRRIGRNLGIPTANLPLPEGTVNLPHGVYACRAWTEGKSYLAVTNLGSRPTVGGHHVTVEPWLLDFEGDLYGKHLTLELHRFLRPEKTFATLPELKAEIQKNACQTREYFENLKKN